MAYKIVEIAESDYGCEERMPGEPLMVLVTLEEETGERICLEVPDHWLISQGLDEGDLWPLEMEEEKDAQLVLEERALEQAKWLDGYLDALEEMRF